MDQRLPNDPESARSHHEKLMLLCADSEIPMFNPWPTGQDFVDLAFGHGLNVDWTSILPDLSRWIW